MTHSANTLNATRTQTFVARLPIAQTRRINNPATLRSYMGRPDTGKAANPHARGHATPATISFRSEKNLAGRKSSDLSVLRVNDTNDEAAGRQIAAVDIDLHIVKNEPRSADGI